MDSLLNWASGSLKNLLILGSAFGALIVGLRFWVKDKIREYKSNQREGDAWDDADIANKRSKRGDDLNDSLFDD